MPKAYNKSSNLDTFVSIAKATVPKPKTPPDYSEARRYLYVGKVIDLFWFDGDLPKLSNAAISYFMNSNWPDPAILPTTIKGINDLSEEEFRFICRRLKKPAWVTSPEVLKGNISYDEFMKEWPTF